jgi:tetratricopeptide (TPR) repeat protein
MPFCEQCGKETSGDSRFCIDCAANTTNQNYRVDSNTQKASQVQGQTDQTSVNKISSASTWSRLNNKKIIIVSSVILIIMLGGILIHNLGNTSKVSKQIEMGNDYLVEGQYKQAVFPFDEAIKMDPNSMPALVGLTQAYIGNDDYDKAQSLLTTIQKTFNLSPKHFNDLINAYIKKGKYDEAGKLLVLAKEKYKKDMTLIIVADDLQTEKEKAEAAKTAVVAPAPLVTPVVTPQPKSVYNYPKQYPTTAPNYPANPNGSVHAIY